MLQLEMWTDEETQILVNNYVNKGPSYCGLYIDKSNACIRAKAKRLGLKMAKPSNKQKTSMEYEMEVMCRDLPLFPVEEYITAHTPILHECFEGHLWKTTPTRILSGKGCPSCASVGFNPFIPAILYYIYIDKGNLQYYKIGITNNSIKSRFGSDIKYIRVVREVLYEQGAKAMAEERRILNKYSQFRQNIPELLVSGGNTELFEFDVLGLDK